MPDVRLTRKEEEGSLPAVCMCCGGPASKWVTRTFALQDTAVRGSGYGALFALQQTIALAQTAHIKFRTSFCQRHRNYWGQRLTLLLGGLGGMFAVLLGGLAVMIFLIVVLHVDKPWLSAFIIVPFLLYMTAYVIVLSRVMSRSIRVRLAPDGSDAVVLQNVHARYIQALQEQRAQPRPARRRAADTPLPEVLPVAIAGVPKLVENDLFAGWEEETSITRRQPPRPRRTESNGVAIALSIVVGVLSLGLVGVKVIVWLENRSKRQQAQQPASVSPAQPPPPAQQHEAAPGKPAPLQEPAPPQEPERDVAPGTIVGNVPATAPLPAELKERPGIDLLPLFNPRKDVVQGRWLLADNILHCSDVGAVPRVQFPYLPPPEYDFIVTFAQPRLRNGISLIMPKPQGGFFFWFVGGDNGSNYGFYTRPLEKGHIPGLIKAGSIHTTKVEVRKKGLRGFVDGKELRHLQTDFGNLTDDGWHRIHNDRYPAVACDDPAVFYHVRIVEVTGHGTKAR